MKPTKFEDENGFVIIATVKTVININQSTMIQFIP